MRLILFAVLSLMLTYDSLAQASDPPCLLDAASMPENWRPPPRLRKSLNPAPWSTSEAKDAEYAVGRGVDEMIDLFKQNPSAVHKLFDDAVAALLQVSFASAGTPEFDAKVRGAARANLTALLEPYLKLDPKSAECDEFEDLLPLVIFAHSLYPPKDALTVAATQRVNAAYRACGSFEAATEGILDSILSDKPDDPVDIDHLEELFNLYAWALLFIEAELYPDIELPAEAREFGPAAWKYFETFRLVGASRFKEGVDDDRFITLADLATHIAHIPSGLHRFPLYVKDKPDLYDFLRQNFYPMLQSGDRDLFALFVDTLRQYGCNSENDVQVRDGTRHLLESFHKGGDRWMNYQDIRKSETDPIEYVKIHHAWTAVLGIRERKLEPPQPGTYGGIVRRWLPHPR